MKTQELNLDEYKNIAQMLNASDEDYNVAIETIKNLNLSDNYLKIFAKTLMFEKRTNFLTILNKKHFNRFSWQELYFEFVNDKEVSLNLKLILEFEYGKSSSSALYMHTIDRNIKLKWND
jgi:hypothetical protein